MASLPSGTVTFLFTDIEGSTRLAQEFPGTWETLRERHHAILRSAMEAHDGHVFQIVGDAFCVAFHTAGEALRSALKSQVDLHAHDWGNTPIRVRMGIHTGKAECLENGEYRGYLAMSRVQRLASAAHGGQVLLSNAAQELVRDDLPEQVSLLDMGEQRLKDLIRPEHIYQLVSPELPAEFPPIKTLDAYRHNLPTQLTSFIGREKEMAEIRLAVAGHRLVTLTGVGGTGKTRLALQVGADLLDQFPNGAWFVELAAITNPELIPQTILTAFKIGDQPGLTSLQLLTNYLQEKELLLILDNCEHLIEATASLAKYLLDNAAGLKILATSREALGVAGELQWHVPSLSLPDIQQLPPIEGLTQYEAVRLFIDRATLAQPHFGVTKDNAPAIAQICSRLDGIPLAIELAAVRVKSLSVDQICERLDDRFRLLTGGSRTALPRQQTLRAAIDWSYALLSEREKILFRRLAVFAGGWRLEAAEQICEMQDSELDVCDLLARLVDKSLVIMDDSLSDVRYRMLETTRQYAQEKLLESGEGDGLRERHRDWYLEFAERGDKELGGPNQILWLHKLDAEVDNLRAALGWSFSANQVEKGARLANALNYFWSRRGYVREGFSWLEKAMERGNQAMATSVRAKTRAFFAGSFGYVDNRSWSEVRPMLEESLKDFKDLGESYRVDYAKVLMDLGFGLYNHDDHATGWAYLQEAIEIFREAGEKSLTAYALNFCVVIKNRESEPEKALPMAEEGLALSQECGDLGQIALQYLCLGEINYYQGNHLAARQYMEKSLALTRDLEHNFLLFQVLDMLGENSRVLNEYEKARACYQESLSIRQEMGFSPQRSWATYLNLGYTVLYLKEDRQALSYFGKALKICRELDQNQYLIDCLAGFAAAAVARGKGRVASTLFGAVDAQLQSRSKTISTFFEPADRLEVERYQSMCRTQLGEAAYESARSEGRALTLEQAIKLALTLEV